MIQLTVGTGVEGTGVLLVLPGLTPVLGELDDARLIGLPARLATLLRPPAGLLLASTDPALAAQERAAAELLAGLLDSASMRPVREALIAFAARQPSSTLAVEARTAALRALPWELLAALPPGRSPLAVEAVSRIQAGPPPALPSPGGTLEVRLWISDPGDTTLAALAEAHRRVIESLPGLSLSRVPADLSGGPTGPGPAVLHLLAHGQGLSRVGLQAAGGARAADTVAAGLAAWSKGAALAVVDVCGGAQATEDPADGPAGRLLLAGVPAAVGPRTRWAAEASRAFCEGLYRAFGEGLELEAALARARLALRMLALPHESARWWTPQALLCTPLAGRIRPLRAVPSLPGFPRPGAAAVPLVQALGRAQGYLGVEHLLAAAADPELVLSPALAPARPALQALARAFPPQPLGGPATPSPRVRALAAELSDGFGPTELIRTLALVPWLARAWDPAARARLLAPGEDDGRGTLPFEPVEAEPMPTGGGLWLEVEGGPDDGRILALRSPGEVLGRWDPGCPEVREHRLHTDRDDADRTLSRTHLRWLGAGRVALGGATLLERGGAPPRRAAGELELRAGDRLVLGASTRLRVL